MLCDRTVDEAALRYDRLVRPFAQRFADHLVGAIDWTDVHRHLDHGAGTGLVCELSSERVPNAYRVALDPSQALLSAVGDGVADRSLCGLAADLATHHRAESDACDPFDLVTSNLVLMFCEDPTVTLRQLASATAPDGRLALTVLGPTGTVAPFDTYWSAVADVIPMAWTPDRYPHHRCADAAQLARWAADAGWCDVTVSTISTHEDRSAEAAWEWLSESLPVGVGEWYGPLAACPSGVDAATIGEIRARWAAMWADEPNRAAAGMLLTGRCPAVGEQVSAKWARWRSAIDLDEYDRRFDDLAARGEDAHGEARLIASYAPQSVLDAGCGMGRVAIELSARGIDAVGVDLDDDLLAYARRRDPHGVWVHDDVATVQLHRRFDIVAMPGNVMIFCKPQARRAIVHNAAQHLQPGGLVIAGFTLERTRDALTLAEYDALCADCELTLVDRFSTWDRAAYEGGTYVVSVHRRSDRFTVHDAVYEARDVIRRYAPHELAELQLAASETLIVDTRTSTDRDRFGVIPGSVHIPRTVVEWHLDPANGYRHPASTGLDQRIVVVCNGGYSSSLAAASLRRLGFTDVGDLIGGVSAWRAAGLPVEQPHHSHLDLG
jgi:SAM-dependent methyltransferase